MGKVYNTVQLVLIVIAVILVLGIGGARLLFAISPHIVVSGSMEPTIPVGSLCFVNEKMQDPCEEDIIAFSKEGMLITHRVLEIRGNTCITKGDNNDTPDPSPVYQNEIIGTTVFWIPVAGYGAAFLQSPGGIIISLTGLAAFILLGHILSDRKRGG